MDRSRRVILLTVSLVVTLGVSTACAQGIGSTPYQPPQPTLSPWLRLYDRNTGALDNYHSAVRPEMQLRSTLRQQTTLLQQQGAGLTGLAGQVNQIENRDMLRPTGAGSVFMDYSHYYDMANTGSRSRMPARRVPGRPAG